MCERLEDLLVAARALVGSMEAAALSAADAVRRVEQFSEIEKVAAAGRTIASGRVAEMRAWRPSGSSSAASWIAQRAGTTLTHAAMTLHTARRLDRAPAVKEAFVVGRLSDVQAAEIAAAVEADPASEEDLVLLAERESVATLRERCRDVRAAAAGDEDATERIRRGRYLRHWTDQEGAVRLDARLAPDDAAPLIAAVTSTAERMRAEAHRSGDPERAEAYAADALVSLAGGAANAVVHVHVSQSALERGHTVAGETCRIEGIGPIAVSAAKRLAIGGSVKVLEAEGVDVRRVAHAGRTIPARLRTALEARDPTCVVPGCSRRHGLEIDHIVPFAIGGRTTLDNLARLCRWHHAQKTHHGWTLGGQPGRWTWTRTRTRTRTLTRSPAAASRGP